MLNHGPFYRVICTYVPISLVNSSTSAEDKYVITYLVTISAAVAKS